MTFFMPGTFPRPWESTNSSGIMIPRARAGLRAGPAGRVRDEQSWRDQGSVPGPDGGLGGEHGQDPGPGVVAGGLAERWCARPEERVLGAWVADQFVLGTRAPQGVADLAALPRIDQGVVVADQIEDPAADPRGQAERR